MFIKRLETKHLTYCVIGGFPITYLMSIKMHLKIGRLMRVKEN